MKTLGVLSGAGVGDAFSEMDARLKSFLNPAAQPGKPAPDSTINWWCWDQPGFKDCHSLAFQAAQQQCNIPQIQGTPIYNTCVVTGADENSKKACQCPDSPPANKLSPDTKAKLAAGALFALAIGIWLYEPKKGNA